MNMQGIYHLRYHQQQDIVDLKNTMNQFNIKDFYSFHTEDTKSIQVPTDYKLCPWNISNDIRPGAKI